LSRRHSFYATKLDSEERAELADIVSAIAERTPAAGPAVDPLIELVALQVWRLRRAVADLAAHGLVRDGGRPAPILGHVEATERRLAENLEKLALTPKSAADLGLTLLRTRALDVALLSPDEQAELARLLRRAGAEIEEQAGA